MIFRMVYALIFLPFSHNLRIWQTEDRILITRLRLHSMQCGKNASKPNPCPNARLPQYVHNASNATYTSNVKNSTINVFQGILFDRPATARMNWQQRMLCKLLMKTMHRHGRRKQWVWIFQLQKDKGDFNLFLDMNNHNHKQSYQVWVGPAV